MSPPTECPVCLEHFDDGELVGAECAHRLCSICWANIALVAPVPWACPMCRSDVTTWILLEVCLQGEAYRSHRNLVRDGLEDRAPREHMELARIGAQVFRMRCMFDDSMLPYEVPREPARRERAVSEASRG